MLTCRCTAPSDVSKSYLCAKYLRSDHRVRTNSDEASGTRPHNFAFEVLSLRRQLGCRVAFDAVLKRSREQVGAGASMADVSRERGEDVVEI
jgi:hypothetical protein